MTTALIPSRGTVLALPLLVIGIGIVSAGLVAGPALAVPAIGAVVAALAAAYAVRRPLVMLTAMTVNAVMNLDGVLAADRSSSLSPRAFLTLGLLTVVISLRDPVMRGRLNRGTLLCIGLVACYPLTQMLAALGSPVFDISMTQLQTIFADCMFLVVALVLAQLSGRPWAIAAAVVVPLAGLSFLSLVSQVGFNGTVSFGGFATITHPAEGLIQTPRYGGPLPDCNFWGRHLVMGVPLAGALIVRAVRSGRQRVALGWAAAMIALLAGVYLTQSRGAIISTAVALLIWVLASGPDARRRGLRSLPLAGLVLIVPGIGNRLVAMVADVQSQGLNREVDPSILGRMASQQIAWAMFRDRPEFGFGPGTFRTVGVPQYFGSVPTAILDRPVIPDGAHNLYAQLASDSGIVGLVGWALFLGGIVVHLAIRVARLSSRSATSPATASERSLAAAVLGALVGWSVASVFLHLAYFRTFAILVALAGALASSAAPSLPSVARLGQQIRGVLLTGIIACAASTVVLVGSAVETHTASQRVAILPTAQMRTNYPYAFGIRTANVLLPTYAAIMAAASPGASAAADTVRGVITISVTKTGADAARASLDEAVANAHKQMARFGFGSSFKLTAVGGVEQKTATRRSVWWTTTSLVAGAAAAVLAARTLRTGLHQSPAAYPPGSSQVQGG